MVNVYQRTVMGWLSNILRFNQKNAVHYVYSDNLATRSDKIGVFAIPFSVQFVAAIPARGAETFVWAFSKTWTGCRGKSGFELALNSNRIKTVSADGQVCSEQPFSLPKHTDRCCIEIQYLQDRFVIHFFSQDNKTLLRMQMFDTMPSQITVGVGCPPPPSVGYTSARLYEIHVTPVG